MGPSSASSFTLFSPSLQIQTTPYVFMFSSLDPLLRGRRYARWMAGTSVGEACARDTSQSPDSRFMTLMGRCDPSIAGRPSSFCSASLRFILAIEEFCSVRWMYMISRLYLNVLHYAIYTKCLNLDEAYSEQRGRTLPLANPSGR